MRQVLLVTLLAATFSAGATDITIMPKPVTVVNNPTAGAFSGAKSTSSQVQRQHQQQSSSNKQQQRASSNSTATGGNAQGGAGGFGGNSQSDNTNNGNNNATNVQIPRNPVSSAASITVMPTAVCSGTTGAGAQGASFGISFGTSWTDENCMRLERIRTTAIILGQQDIAAEMMCVDEEYRAARQAMGQPCSTAVIRVVEDRREQRRREIETMMYKGGNQ